MTQNPKKNFFKETLRRHSLLFVFIGLSFTPRLFSQSLFHEHHKNVSAEKPAVEAVTASVETTTPASVEAGVTAPVAKVSAVTVNSHKQAVVVSTPVLTVKDAEKKYKKDQPASPVKEIAPIEPPSVEIDSAEPTILPIKPVRDVPFPADSLSMEPH